MSTSQQGRVSGKRTTAPAGRKPAAASRPPRRRVTIQRVHPWSVLKLSLIFYFCMLLVVMVALTLFWSVIINLGVLEAVQSGLSNFGATVRINGGNLARMVFLIGLINVVLWSAINVFMAFLYNLIADLVGGFRVTLSDDDATS